MFFISCENLVWQKIKCCNGWIWPRLQRKRYDMGENSRIVSWGSRIKKRLTVKSAIIIILVASIQVILFWCISLQWGAAAQERKEIYTQFRNTVYSRTFTLQDKFLKNKNVVDFVRGDLEEYINKGSGDISASAGKNQCGEYNYNETLLKDNIEKVRELITYSESQGAFIVLYSNDKDESHQGVYVRLDDEGEEELLVGSEEFLAGSDLIKSDRWQADFRITDTDRCGFYNRLKDGDYYGNTKCGCMSPVFTLYGDTKKIMTYTVPLLDKEGNFYGVLGVELDIDRLIAQMPYSELGSDKDSMYYIAYKPTASSKAIKEILSASVGTDVTNKNGVLEYSRTNIKSIYQIKKENKTYVATYQKLELEEMTGDDESWVVYGVINKNSLLEDYQHRFLGSLILVIALAIAGSIANWYFILILSRKIRKMSVQVQENRPQDDWKIDGTDIVELDTLGEICRDLFEKGLSAAKLSETIDLINVSIGAIEYDENEEHVFCSAKAVEILEFHNADDNSHYMQKKIFDTELKVFYKSVDLYDKKSDIYHMVSKDGHDKYIRVKKTEGTDKWLMAVMDVTEEVRERLNIEYERDHDLLTRLMNRMSFRRRVEELLDRDDLGIAAIVMVDLDNLKYFNDTYGHDYGDKYICTAASVLGNISSDNILVARMSGDEFLMFLYGYESKEEIKEIVVNVHNNLKDAGVSVPTGEIIKLRASAGISWYPENACNLDELIRFADFAMYESKNNMKGTINEFSDEQFNNNKVLFQGSEDLNRIIENSENIKYAFHPIVDARTGEVFAYEMLMRPTIESLRSPEDVMRLASSQSRLYDIELMTWREGLKAAAKQRKPGDKYRLFINSVPNHELRGEDLNMITDLYGDMLNRVVIEIIENEQADKHCMESKFKWAEKYGMSIALDDFGTGYSNEATLLYINPKYVKIDMSMVKNIHNDENRQKIVQNLVSYTKPRDIKVIAEGVEDFEDMDVLISLGVDYLQGWYFTKPLFDIIDIKDKFKKEIIECNRSKG